MTEEQLKPTLWLWWTIAGLMLLVVYPLSLWPVSGFANRGCVSHKVLIAYAPVLFAWETFLPDHQMPDVLNRVDVEYALYVRDGARLRRMIVVQCSGT